MQIQPSNPTQPEFTKLLQRLYPADSPRHRNGFDPVAQHLHGCYILKHEQQVVGRFALYDNPDLQLEGKPAAALGSYECTDDPEVARHLLEAAKTLARQLGKRHLIGPMEGSTWQAHRFSRHHRHEPFFSEPYHNLYYHRQFLANDFQELMRYRSALDVSPRFDEVRFARLQRHFTNRGIELRPLKKEALNTELEAIGTLSIRAFRDNFLYTPISVGQFMEKYRPLVARLDANLIWLARDRSTDETVGFIFALPDLYDPTGRTLLIKTVARAEGFRLRGLGTYLTDLIYKIAPERGYDRIVHAFMRDDNDSIRISERLNGSDYKSYALYNCKL